MFLYFSVIYYAILSEFCCTVYLYHYSYPYPCKLPTNYVPCQCDEPIVNNSTSLLLTTTAHKIESQSESVILCAAGVPPKRVFWSCLVFNLTFGVICLSLDWKFSAPCLVCQTDLLYVSGYYFK